MKQALKFAGSLLINQLTMMVIAMVFLTQTLGNDWLFYILTVVFLAGSAYMLYLSGCQRGERAATLSASIEHQRSEGRAISAIDESQQFQMKTAIYGYIFGVLPALLLAVVTFLTRDMFIMEGGTDNWLGVITRIVFSPYLPLTVIFQANRAMLYAMYIPCALIVPLAMPIGYMQGPRLRQKKLVMIEHGKKRKMRNLKVNKRRNNGPKPPKMEV